MTDPETFKPNPGGVSNLEMTPSFEVAPDDDELSDEPGTGMTEEEALAFLNRPVGS